LRTRLDSHSIWYSYRGQITAIEILESSGIEIDTEDEDNYARRLFRDSRKTSLARGIEIVLKKDEDSGNGEYYYVSRKTVAQLLGSTLLAQMLPPLTSDIDKRPINDKIETGRIITKHRGKQLESVGGDNRFLALALNDELPRLLVGKLASEGDYWAWRVFHEESFSGFSNVSYLLRTDSGKLIAEGRLEDYASTLEEQFKIYHSASVVASFQTHFTISRSAIAEAILDAVRNLAGQYHNGDRVHGDLKPQNILMTRNGAILIDSLNLEQGEITVAVTPAWGAPEQIAGLPVTKSTDLYPVGLMLTSMLNGLIGGELVRFQYLAENKNLVTTSFIRNPIIYLNHDDGLVQGTAKEKWLSTIQRCLAFRPEERYQDANELVEELEKILFQFPPSGSVTLEYSRGVLQAARLPTRDISVCRVIDDEPYGEREVGEFCDNCGEAVVKGKAFCHKCGTSISQNNVTPKSRPQGKICTNCGATVLEGETICHNCGNAITTYLGRF